MGTLLHASNWAGVGRVLFSLAKELVGQGSHTQLPALPPPLQVEWENAELRDQLLGVTQERDLALRKSQGLQSKLESLEQVLKVRGLCWWGKRVPGTERKAGWYNTPFVGHWGLRPSLGAASPFLL